MTIISTICMVLLLCGFAEADTTSRERADLILLQPEGKKQDRAVPYLHDLHTQFVGDQNDSCRSCHPEQGKQNRLSLSYMRRMRMDLFSDNIDLKALYHANCIGCHQRMEDAGQASGPTAFMCGNCHGAKEEYVSELEPFEMGKSLHMRHIFGIDRNRPIFSCQLCHHTYDEKLGQTEYKRGKEDSCRYCHKQTQSIQHGDMVLSLADASHLTCITCHKTRIRQHKTHGPVSCSGCHGLEQQKAIQARDDAYQAKQIFPQLDRGQQDYCTVHLADGVPSPTWGHQVDFMPLVAFPHRIHEDQSKTCRVCHHASMEPCAKRCHTLNGREEGDFWTLRKVMHSPDNTRGCVGCHAEQQSEKQCAGCHPPQRRGVLRQSQCGACHNIALEDPRKDDFAKTFLVRNFGKEGEAAMAKRPRITTTYPDADIPETVRMDKLADTWAPAEMPHRRIVRHLVDDAGASGLAAYFHASPGTFCQGCHHQQPAEKIPSACSHCHGNAQSRTLEKLPELKDAYHTACIGCHQRMGLTGEPGGKKKTAPGPQDCQECHKAKQ